MSSIKDHSVTITNDDETRKVRVRFHSDDNPNHLTEEVIEPKASKTVNVYVGHNLQVLPAEDPSEQPAAGGASAT